MIKQIALPIAVIAIAAGTTLGATGAFFSDSETSTANTFTAGTLNLTLNDWGSNGASTHAPFSISGMMPGQEEAKTIEIKSTAAAWLRLSVSDVVAEDSAAAGAINGNADANNGDIDDELVFDAILVDAAGAVISPLATNKKLAELSTPIYVTSQLAANTAMYVKIVAKLPGATLNGAQGDKVTFDVNLDALQAANNAAPIW